MKIITIKNNGWGNLSIIEKRIKGARLEWRADGFECYLSGGFADCYNLAAVKCVDYASRLNIPAWKVRCVHPATKKTFKYQSGRKLL